MGIKNYKKKKNACLKALDYLPKKGRIGLGSGSTIDLMASFITPKKGQSFLCVSKNAKKILDKKGAKLIEKLGKTDVAFDGADVFTQEGVLKGAGGFDFVSEKKLDYNTKKLFLIADDTKLRKKNGKIFIEIKKGKEEDGIATLKKLGIKIKKVRKDNPKIRRKNNSFFWTDSKGKKLKTLETLIEDIPAVEGCGIFTKKKYKKIIGNDNGAVVK